MKFAIVRDRNDPAGKSHYWRIETDAGFVLAESKKPVGTKEKCAKEIADVKKDAALMKIIER